MGQTRKRNSHHNNSGMIASDSPDDVRSFIKNHLPIRVDKKNSNGEVFTPRDLVCKMLDSFPKEVWSNPKLRWIDPACGVGNFPVEVFYRLDDGLRKKMPETQKRRHHIIHNMLYMVELDDRNYKAVREIFGDDANIFHGSFLDDEWKKAFGGLNVKYDCVIGNPPYNQGRTLRGGMGFWTKFVTASLDILAPGGYICFVHPNGWRKTVKGRESSGDIWSHYRRDGHLVYLNMDGNDPYKKYGFPTVDFYLWKQGKQCGSKCDTMVDATLGKLHYSGKLSLNKLPFIPSFVSPSVISIIQKLEKVPKDDRLNISHKQAFKASGKDTRKLRPTKNNKTRSKRNSDRRGVPHAFVFDHKTKKYTMAYRDDGRKANGDASCPKVVMTFKGPKENGRLYPVFYEKPTATTDNTMYQCVHNKAQGERLIKYLESDLVVALMKITQFTDRPNHRNDHYVLNMLPDVAKKNVKGLSLTKAEEDVIKRIVKNH